MSTQSVGGKLSQHESPIPGHHIFHCFCGCPLRRRSIEPHLVHAEDYRTSITPSLTELSSLGIVAALVTARKKTNFSTVSSSQAVGIREVQDEIWLVSFMDYDLGYIDLEEKTLQPLDNPFGPRV